MTENDSAAATDSTTEAPCCWLCLEEGPDASAKQLIRDCSCRGMSGYAHLSCIIGWAENESKRGDTRKNAFLACPNCKQPYQNQLRHDLSKARVKFAEREYTMDNAEGVAIHAGAIMNRMTLLDAENQTDRREMREICTKLHRIIEFTKTDNSRRWSQTVASGYMSIATFYLRMGMRFGYTEWKDSLHTAKEYYNLAMEIYRTETDDLNLSVSSIEKMIAIIDARLSGIERNVVNKESDIKIERSKFKFYLDNLGKNHITTINAGLLYSQTLFDFCYTVNAERLVTKLYGRSQRAHGVDHNCTMDAFRLLTRVRERRVCVKSRPGETFQALRYVESNNTDHDDDQIQKLVLQGPIAIPRNVSKEQTMQQDCANISYVYGTPVIFCLPSIPRLHDKVGSVMEFDEETNTYSVYCEVEENKVGMRAKKVEQRHLRIAFDLPEDAE